MNSLFMAIADKQLLTVRIDLDPPSRAASGLPQRPSRLAVILSVIQVADAAGNLLMPQRSYTAHLDHLRIPRWLQSILPTIKVAGSAGLMLGLQRPRVQALTSAALAGYYGGAIAFHLAAEDPAIIAAPAAALAAVATLTAAGSCPPSPMSP